MRLKLTRFSGLAPRQTDRNLQESFASIAENVNLERGTIQAWNEPAKVSDQTGYSLFMASCCPIIGDCDTSFAETGIDCGEILVASGLGKQPVFTTETCPPHWEPLGFPCKMAAPAVKAPAAKEDFSMDLRSYYYTVVNRMGWESAPSLPSAPVRVNIISEVSIGEFEVPSNAVTIRIYRAQTQLDYGTEPLENDDSVFLLVGEIPVSQPVFTDTVKIAGFACETEQYSPPPENLYEICSLQNGRLCGLVGNHFMMSERGAPHAWPDKTKVSFYDKPLALKCVRDVAYVLTAGRPVVIQVNGDCEDGVLYNVSTLQQTLPILSRRSAATHAGGVVYAAAQGLVFIAGQQAVVLTRDFYTPQQWGQLQPHTMVGCVHDGVYYGSTATTCIRFDLPDEIFATQDDTALTTISLRPRAMYSASNDRLYMALEDGTYEWNTGTGKMMYHWRSKVHYAPGPVRFSAYKIFTDGIVSVYHSTEHGEISRNATSLKPARLPSGRKGQEWFVDFRGTAEISEYTLATSIRDLSHD